MTDVMLLFNTTRILPPLPFPLTAAFKETNRITVSLDVISSLHNRGPHLFHRRANHLLYRRALRVATGSLVTLSEHCVPVSRWMMLLRFFAIVFDAIGSDFEPQHHRCCPGGNRPLVGVWYTSASLIYFVNLQCSARARLGGCDSHCGIPRACFASRARFGMQAHCTACI